MPDHPWMQGNPIFYKNVNHKETTLFAQILKSTNFGDSEIAKLYFVHPSPKKKYIYIKTCSCLKKSFFVFSVL